MAVATFIATNIAAWLFVLLLSGVTLAVSVTSSYFMSSDLEETKMKVETQQLQINRLERELEHTKGEQDGRIAMREGDH